MSKKKIGPWRIITAVISAGYILYMWTEKDIATIYATAPQEQVLPMVVTALLVAAGKVALIAAAVLVGRWLLRILKGKK